MTITSGFANEPAPAWGYGGSRHAVERHDGTIEISSAVGNGTTVTVRVPLQANAE